MNYLINFQLKDRVISCLDRIVEVLDTNFQQVKEKRCDYFPFIQSLQKTASFWEQY